jgi:putative membrane protein
MFEGHGLGGGFMWLFWILVIVAIAWLVRAVVAGAGDGRNQQKPSSPLEILEERFARGEIDEAEFERKRKLLRR